MSETGNPTFRIDGRSPRPKSLKELYQLVIETCPNESHNENIFIGSIINQLDRDPIRNRSLKSEVEKEKSNLILEKEWPLNDFWYGAEKYLKNLGAQEVEVKKLWAMVRDGFKSD